MGIMYFLPILMGVGIGTQTAINSKLRGLVFSPILASAISFVVGTIFLLVILLITGVPIGIPGKVFSTEPLWVWFGGILGVTAITSNVFLFPVLGSIQTSILPILGQILMGVLIDQFGLFNSPRISLTVARVTGVLVVLIGISISVGFFKIDNLNKIEKEENINKISYQLWAVLTGAFMASQSAINGFLGTILNSSIHAGAVSFSLGTLLLTLIIIVTKTSFTGVKIAIQYSKKSWWVWVGGLLGAVYATGASWLVPKIGTGSVVVFALFGQMSASALIEHFGLFHSTKKRLSVEKIVGMGILLIGVFLVNFL